MYSIWLLEYAHVTKQPIGSILAGQHNAGFCELTFSYMVLKGNGHTIMIDTGTNGNDPVTQKLHERDSVTNWHSPDEILAKVGVRPEEVDTIFITHAHYDHMDYLSAFPNATFYIQEKELLGWVWAMTRPKKYRFPHLALKSDNIYEALHLVEEGRMLLLDGMCKDVLPGIDVYPAYDGHTFASEIVLIRNAGKKWAVVGDLAYQRQNFTGLNNSGVYVPVGIATGSPYNITKTLDEILALVDGDLKQVVIGHETDNWELYPSKKGEEGLWMSEIALGEDEVSKL